MDLTQQPPSSSSVIAHLHVEECWQSTLSDCFTSSWHGWSFLYQILEIYIYLYNIHHMFIAQDSLSESVRQAYVFSKRLNESL